MEAPTIAPYSALDFRRRAERERAPHGETDYGDHHFNPGHPRLTPRAKLRAAAVLIPVVDRGDEATVLLTRRADTLRDHSGQVAFPGGRIDATDPTPEFAALREATEEIGLGSEHAEIIGRMPDYLAGSGYRITPVLAIVRPGFDLRINRHEVDAVFEVPLRFLMDPANHHRASSTWHEREWVFFDMAYGGQRIWGVTAGIIRTLHDRLYA